METITNSNYYDNKTHITNSMIHDFVSYNKYWNRTITPETYYAKHISKKIKFGWSDAMLKWTIVDKYFSEWPYILQDYPAVSKRSWNNPNEITNSMNESIQEMIKIWEAFKTFQELINLSTTINWTSDQSIVTSEIETINWIVKIKWKMDYINHDQKWIIDLKTTANVETLWEDLQFKWDANIFHKYIRQGALYNKLLPWYSFAIAVIDDAWRMKFIPVRQDILDESFNYVLQDITELQTYYTDNWTKLIKDPFNKKETTDEIIL